MEHPAAAVGGLQGGAQLIPLVVELEPQLQQAFNAVGRLPYQQIYSGGIAEAGPCLEGVLLVQFRAIIGAHRSGQAPLGPTASGAHLAPAAQQKHPGATGELQAAHQSSGTTAHHHHIPGGAERVKTGRFVVVAQRYWPSLIRSKPSLRAISGSVTVKLSRYLANNSFWRPVRSSFSTSSTLP